MKYTFNFNNIAFEFCGVIDYEDCDFNLRIEYKNGQASEDIFDNITSRLQGVGEFDSVIIRLWLEDEDGEEIEEDEHELSAKQFAENFCTDYLCQILKQTSEVNLDDFEQVAPHIYLRGNKLAVINGDVLDMIDLYEPDLNVVFNDVLIIPCRDYLFAMDVNTFRYEKTPCR